MNVTVKRSEWLRGQMPSFLLHPRSEMKCCLGFACLQAGAEPDEIRGLSLVNTAASRSEAVARAFPRGPSGEEFLSIAYQLNDTRTLSDESREQRLAAHFAANDHALTFVD